MESIRWITTPKCSACVPQPDFARRPSCRGCCKLTECALGSEGEPVRPVKHALGAERRLARDREIAGLRANGASYGAIAKKLGMPRSTVQCAAQRAVRTGNAGGIALY